MIVKLNVNDKVRVELTDYGKKTLYERDSAIYGLAVAKRRLSTDGRHQFPLWELMNIFGSCMYNGAPKMPFVKNKVELGDIE